MSLGRMIQDALLDGSGLSKKEAERLAVHIIEAGARQGLHSLLLSQLGTESGEVRVELFNITRPGVSELFPRCHGSN